MAGKIALGIIGASILCALSYCAGWQRRELQKVECKVLQIVTEEHPDFKNAYKIPVPYTIAGRGFEVETHVLPGIRGRVGDTVTIHQ